MSGQYKLLFQQYALSEDFSVPLSVHAVASKDVTNWWLAYWVSTFRYHGDNPMNISAFNITSAHFYLDHENYRFPAFNITESGSNKYFYIGIYLGLAAANSVSPSLSVLRPLLLAAC